MKIYLAGAESPEHIAAILENGAPHLLMSFFHGPWKRGQTRRGGATDHKLLAALMHTKTRFIDSGAYTLRTAVATTTGTKHNEGGAGVDFDAYLDAYVRWIKKMRALRLVDWWVEMDIGVLTGDRWVAQQRQRWAREGLGDGLVEVWHSDKGWDEWTRLLHDACRSGRSRYIAIEGRQNTGRVLNYTRFLHAAYRHGVRVHGFKMTTAKDLQVYPFYSVDSTTWLMPVHAGAAPGNARAGGVVQIRPDAPQTDRTMSRRALNGRRLLWHGPLPRKQTRFWRHAALRVSVRAWMRTEAKFDRLWRSRGVDWETAVTHPAIQNAEEAHDEG